MEGWQETQMQALSKAASEAEIFALLSGLASEIGFSYCAFGMRMPLPVSQPKLFIINNYSTAWQQRYQLEDYISVDPTVAHGLRSVMPLVWSDALFENARPLWEDARAHGLRFGWAQSCHDAQGVGGLLTLARPEGALSGAELRAHGPQMAWLAQAMHTFMARMLVPKLMPEALSRLTAREKEVLRWTADGKTSHEIGDILSISEHTVNFHIKNSLAKLNATNKTAGVIKAAMMGLL